MGTLPEAQYVEAHGRAELYRCDRGDQGCAGGGGRVLDLWPWVCAGVAERTEAAGAEGGAALGPPPTRLESVPRCEECGEGVMRPACLMFDVGDVDFFFFFCVGRGCSSLLLVIFDFSFPSLSSFQLRC